MVLALLKLGSVGVFQRYNPPPGLGQLYPEKGSDLLEKGPDCIGVGFSRNLLD
jgi:hypothetical protein